MTESCLFITELTWRKYARVEAITTWAGAPMGLTTCYSRVTLLVSAVSFPCSVPCVTSWSGILKERNVSLQKITVSFSLSLSLSLSFCLSLLWLSYILWYFLLVSFFFYFGFILSMIASLCLLFFFLISSLSMFLTFFLLLPSVGRYSRTHLSSEIRDIFLVLVSWWETWLWGHQRQIASDQRCSSLDQKSSNIVDHSPVHSRVIVEDWKSPANLLLPPLHVINIPCLFFEILHSCVDNLLS
jgi:hypothetical protein